ncbi:uncharacterized protein VDAG_01982 [Verticillium dahliae VdLs.17]|uniref:Uncharacterized protein n=1 Tax=Verticillium dahliae (strain VdLs.17 / ATCC MYA-4575 / FGSC 10137) TaxID=498257 RepID=G2WWJ6_VERDV|nr:uncharacterized protein VDAG_01982 [Verticillium dahliae VdLs.17]EGY19966.1 hypothetical protein VDAG_01982 [Verticillium dahliae VdLs.17]
MPKQYTLLGRSLPRLSTRRLSFLLVCFSIFAVLSLLISLPNALSPDSQLTRYTEHIPKIPTIKIPFAQSVLNPFKQPSHPPPRQKNDTYDESSWWADWKWLSVPFSSSLTLDEDRSLLPPLKERPPIYCYYDATIKKDDALKDAESDLLLTWRRAWWAQGFRPVILSAAEAMQNPLFADVQRATLDAGLRADLMRWLAWENMGGGLLTYYTTLPMGSREDPLLASFRRAEYPKLTRWEKLGSGLLAGPQTEVAAAIKEILASDQAAQAKDLLAIVSKNTFVVYKKPAAIAWYDANTVEGKFAKVATAIVEDPAKGLRSLIQLINSHLHTTWQEHVHKWHCRPQTTAPPLDLHGHRRLGPRRGPLPVLSLAHGGLVSAEQPKLLALRLVDAHAHRHPGPLPQLVDPLHDRHRAPPLHNGRHDADEHVDHGPLDPPRVAPRPLARRRHH